MISILETLSELRDAVGLPEARTPFDDAVIDRMMDRIKDIIDDNFKDAVKAETPELAGAWVDIFHTFSEEEPQALRDGKPSAETMRVRKLLAADGYLFYKPRGSSKEFVYAPGKTPAHANIEKLGDMRSRVMDNLRKATTPEEKESNEQALAEIDQKIADEQASDIMKKSEKAASKKVVKLDDTDMLNPADVAAHEAAVAAAEEAEAAAAAESDPKKRTELEKEAAQLWTKADELSPKPVKKADAKAGGKKSPAAAAAADDETDADKSQPLFWQKKRVGGFQQTRAAMDAVDKFDSAMNQTLDILAKDPQQGRSTGDRKTRLANLIRSLRDTVFNAETALNKVGVPKEQPAKVAEEVENA